MSSAEFTEWLAFYRIEPYGYAANFVGHAQTSATIANVHRGKDTPPYKVEDFMPKEPEPPQSMEQMLTIAKNITAAYGGDIEIEEGGNN